MSTFDRYKKIFDAWITSMNPSEIEKKIAEDRINICTGCEFIKGTKVFKWAGYCKKCGCPINKKVFSKAFNDCPMKKWEEIDSKNFPDYKTKKDKTPI